MNHSHSLSLPTILSVTLVLAFLSSVSVNAQCVTILGKKACLSDIDPTKIIPGSKEFAEQSWGEAGAAAYQAATEIMLKRHGSSQRLDETQKGLLRIRYGGLVDTVNIIYGAKMMDKWCAFGKCTETFSAAQTYCNRIYVADQYKPDDLDQVLLLAHELRHSEQCREAGGEGKFGFHYFREYKRANQNYETNSMEVDARQTTNEFYQKFILGKGIWLASAEGKVYIVANGRKSWIAGPAWFEANGFDWGAIKPVPTALLRNFSNDPNLNRCNLPNDTLIAMRDEEKKDSPLDGRVFAIKDGRKHYIPSPAVLERLYGKSGWGKIRKLTRQGIETIPEGEPLR